MARNRVSFEDWISALCVSPERERSRDRDWVPDSKTDKREREATEERADKISREVRRAMELLDSGERESIELYYFMGESLENIPVRLSVSKRQVEKNLRVGTLKMKRILYQFVRESFQLKNAPSQPNCLICASSDRNMAEKIIKSKKPEEPWRRIIRELREKLGIEIRTPQTLIGHVRYHLLAGIKRQA
ncbi:MAG: hypothetical protein IIB00_04465 [candidate division Zixibacteria bacterium]|nr:hypothetical protein [candidate division Zixibacteria bacterium]